jgi:hypothetical protein
MEALTCSLLRAELTAILYAFEHARDILRSTANVCIAIKGRDTLSVTKKRHRIRYRREVSSKVANAVLEMESVGHRVTSFLVHCEQGLRGIAEAKKGCKSCRRQRC